MSPTRKYRAIITKMISNNIYINVRKAIVIRSHQVENGATVLLGLASDFFEKTGALKIGVRMSHIREYCTHLRRFIDPYF